MNKAPRVATLAVGTEITDGQISDRNSQWLSARAVELGYDVIEHRAVRDDREKILLSLTELALEADVVFVTGGLGPTSDDFTRECVAQFLGEVLEWHEPSWENISERLKARGAKVTENQKQQCFYPRGSKILKNPGGTANAFTALTSKGIRIVCLPGPPREIEAIWDEGLAALMRRSEVSSSRELLLLRTMGMGEGALASRVEEIVDEALILQPSVIRPAVGYRAHAPYVEVKLWADASQSKLVSQVAKAIRHEFSEILINEGEDDVADALIASVATEAEAGIRTCFYDGVTQGQLFARLLQRANDRKDETALRSLSEHCTYVIASSFEASADSLQPEAKTSVLTLKIGNSDLELVVGRGAREKRISLPKLASSLHTDRGRKWAIELALIEWSHST